METFLNLTPQDTHAIWLSIKVACGATLIATPFGFAVAYLLVFARVPGKALIEGLVNLPLVLPPVVVGYLLLLLFGQSGFLGPLLQRYRYPHHLHPVGSGDRLGGGRFSASGSGHPHRHGRDRPQLSAGGPDPGRGLVGYPSDHHPAAFGAGVLAGMTLMFARSLGEFGATIILAGNIPGVTQTIPLAIYEYTNTPGGDTMALNLCLVSIVLSFAVLLLSEAATVGP